MIRSIPAFIFWNRRSSFYRDGENFDFSKDLFPKPQPPAPLVWICGRRLLVGHWKPDQYRQAHYDLLTGKIRWICREQRLGPVFGRVKVWKLLRGLRSPVRSCWATTPEFVKGQGSKSFGDRPPWLGPRGCLCEAVHHLAAWLYWRALPAARAILADRCHLKAKVAVYEGAVLGEGCTVAAVPLFTRGSRFGRRSWLRAVRPPGEPGVGTCSVKSLFSYMGRRHG